MRWHGLVRAVAALALLASACDSGSTAGESAAEAPATTGVAAAQAREPAERLVTLVSSEPVTLGPEETWPAALVGECDGSGCSTPWEDEWRRDRARVAMQLADVGGGVDSAGVLRGPGGLEIDLSECPADWDPAVGVSDDEIVIGDVRPLSGGLAIPTQERGFWRYIDWVNENRGVGGRHIRLETRDDAGRPANTLAVSDELLAENEPLLVTTVLLPSPW